MKRFMIALMFLVLASACGHQITGDQIPNRCSLDWLGPAETVGCQTWMEIGRNHIYLEVVGAGGHRITAIFHGWFPEDLDDYISGTQAYITMQLPGWEAGWCTNEMTMEYVPPAGNLGVRMNADETRAEVEFYDRVTCDGSGWRCFTVSAVVDVVWLEERRNL